MRLIPFSAHAVALYRRRLLPCVELVTDDFGNEIDYADDVDRTEPLIDQALHFMEGRFYDRGAWVMLQDEEPSVSANALFY